MLAVNHSVLLEAHEVPALRDILIALLEETLKENMDPKPFGMSKDKMIQLIERTITALRVAGS